MCCRCCSVTQQKCWVFGTGSVTLVLGLLLIIWGPQWMTDMTYKMLPLSPTSRTFKMWAELPVPIYMYMFMYNWTNAEEVRTKGVKPHFQEVGPYVYREDKVKKDLVWHKNKTVSYYGQRTWFFEPELSNGTESDIVTCPHIPSIAAANVVQDQSLFIKFVFNRILNNNGGSLYQTHNVSSWLFAGFYDEFLDYAMKLNNSMTGPIESNEFAYFLNRNGSKEFEGLFTVHTGQGNLREMGEIKFWKGMNHTGFFEGDCGKLNGSTSDLWVPNRGLDEYITLYIVDTCRIINLVPTGEWTTIAGVKGMKYETKPDTFDNGQHNPDMKCYCPADMQPDNCPKTGATHLGGCSGGAPMYLSHAHFMYADPSYASTITGLSPDYDKHNFFIIMEPRLAIPLQVNAAVQVSLHIQRDKDITILRNVPDFYAPLFTVASRAIVDEELGKQVQLALNLPDITRYVGIGIACLGFVVIVIGVVLTATRNWYRQDKHHLDSHANSDQISTENVKKPL